MSMDNVEISEWKADESGGYSEAIVSIMGEPTVLLRAVKNGEGRWQAVMRRKSNGHMIAQSPKDYATEAEAQKDITEKLPQLLRAIAARTIEMAASIAALLSMLSASPRRHPMPIGVPEDALEFDASQN